MSEPLLVNRPPLGICHRCAAGWHGYLMHKEGAGLKMELSNERFQICLKVMQMQMKLFFLRFGFRKVSRLHGNILKIILFIPGHWKRHSLALLAVIVVLIYYCLFFSNHTHVSREHYTLTSVGGYLYGQTTKLGCCDGWLLTPTPSSCKRSLRETDRLHICVWFTETLSLNVVFYKLNFWETTVT